MSSQGPTTKSTESPKQSGIPEASKPIEIVPGYRAAMSRPIASSAPVATFVPGQTNTSNNEGIDVFGTSPRQPGKRRVIGL